eukprot:1373053-Rhodomonas_salina.3
MVGWVWYGGRAACGWVCQWGMVGSVWWKVTEGGEGADAQAVQGQACGQGHCHLSSGSHLSSGLHLRARVAAESGQGHCHLSLFHTARAHRS